MHLALLPAFPLTPAMFDEVRGEFASVSVHDLGRIALELHAADVEPDLDVVADFVALELAGAGVAHAVIGGVSIGGYVTMAMLRRHSRRVAGVVLADTTMTADTPDVVARRVHLASTLNAEKSVRIVLDEVLPGLLGATTHRTAPAVVSRAVAMAGAVAPEALAWLQLAMAGRPDSLETLRECHVPALVIVGEEDEPTPPAQARAMAAALSDVRLVQIPAAGHLSALEQPAAFAAAIRLWLDDRFTADPVGE